MELIEEPPVELIERIDRTTENRAGHEFRYRVAAGYIRPTDTVLDAGCGTGYGAQIVQPCRYVGVDIADVVEEENEPFGEWTVADLCTWSPGRFFDVAICFETLEHVQTPERLMDLCCKARRLVVCSVPIVPTVGANPFHLHDFTMWDMPRLFAERGWHLEQCVLQPSELSAIYVFSR